VPPPPEEGYAVLTTSVAPSTRFTTAEPAVFSEALARDGRSAQLGGTELVPGETAVTVFTRQSLVDVEPSLFDLGLSR